MSYPQCKHYIFTYYMLFDLWLLFTIISTGKSRLQVFFFAARISYRDQSGCNLLVPLCKYNYKQAWRRSTARRLLWIDSRLCFLTLQHNHKMISTWSAKRSPTQWKCYMTYCQYLIATSDTNTAQMSEEELLAFCKTVTFSAEIIGNSKEGAHEIPGNYRRISKQSWHVSGLY